MALGGSLLCIISVFESGRLRIVTFPSLPLSKGGKGDIERAREARTTVPVSGLSKEFAKKRGW